MVTPKNEKEHKMPRLVHTVNKDKMNGPAQNFQGSEVRRKSEVGPGSYNMKKFDMSYDLDYKGQSFSRETRFNFKRTKR